MSADVNKDVQTVAEGFNALRNRHKDYYSIAAPSHSDLCDLNYSVSKSLGELATGIKGLSALVQNLEAVPVDLLTDLGTVFNMIKKDWDQFATRVYPESVILESKEVCTAIVKTINTVLEDISNEVIRRANSKP